MKKKVIEITCEGAGTELIENLVGFQGDLKDLDLNNMERLKTEMITYGFNSPVQILKKGKQKKKSIIDGNQRLRVLISLRDDDGYKIPKAVPVDYIYAKNMKEARHILLSRVKQYGVVTAAGLRQYIDDSDMDISYIKESFGDFPGINIEQFDKEWFHPPEEKNPVGATEILPESYSNMVHECPKCKFRFGKGAAKEKTK